MGDLRGAREVLGLTKDRGKEKGEEKRKRSETVQESEDDDAKAEDHVNDSNDDGDEDEAADDPTAPSSTYTEALIPLLSLASGSFPTATSQLRSSLLPATLARTNQAVISLYSGHLNEARDILEDLVEEAVGKKEGGAGSAGIPATLLFNLATCYELLTDRARGLKTGLAEKVAGLEGSGREGWERGVGDFKL